MVDIFLKDMPLSKQVAWDFEQLGQVEGVHGRELRTRGSLRFFPSQPYSMILLFYVSFDLEQKSKGICRVCVTQTDR